MRTKESETTAPPTGTVRGADELDFLGSRQHSTPVSVATARAKTQEVTKGARVEDLKAGLVAHTQGTGLIEAYMRHVDAVLGYPSFAAYLAEHWPLGDDVAYDRMRVARFFTEAECGTWGFSVCKHGVRLLEATGVESIDKLREVDVHLLKKDGGGVVRFPAPVRQLQAALRALKNPELADDSGTAGERLERTRHSIRTLVEARPAYAELEPRAWLKGGEPAVGVSAVGPRLMALAAEFMSKLSRKR